MTSCGLRARFPGKPQVLPLGEGVEGSGLSLETKDGVFTALCVRVPDGAEVEESDVLDGLVMGTARSVGGKVTASIDTDIGRRASIRFEHEGGSAKIEIRAFMQGDWVYGAQIINAEAFEPDDRDTFLRGVEAEQLK